LSSERVSMRSPQGLVETERSANVVQIIGQP
jgi:hypothetical protein